MSAPKPAGTAVARKERSGPSLVATFASKYMIEPGNLLAVLRGTAFKTKQGEPPATNEELQALLVVAHQYSLNPFIREIYAFRGRTGIVPIIGYDGWIKLVQSQPDFNGEQFKCGVEPETDEGMPSGFYYECTMYRRNRQHPTVVREYLSENKRPTDNWNLMPNRMLRMRSYIQCARVCFGLGGIYDEDEGLKVSLGEGADYFPGTATRAAATRVETPQAQEAEEPFATDEQIGEINRALAKTGVPDNLVMARFEVADFNELKFSQVESVLKFIKDNEGG